MLFSTLSQLSQKSHMSGNAPESGPPIPEDREGFIMSETTITRLCLALTVAAVALAGTSICNTLIAKKMPLGLVLQAIVFGTLLLALVYGNFVYVATRFGYYRRLADHKPLEKEDLWRVFYGDRDPASVCILIPSYKEEARVILQTMLSAALVEYPAKQLVLLVDDPPLQTGASQRALQETRDMVKRLDRIFSAKARQFQNEKRLYNERLAGGDLDIAAEAARLAALYEEAARFVEKWGAEFDQATSATFAHTDLFFREHILLRPAEAHRQRAIELRHVRSSLDLPTLSRDYARLAALFTVKISSFERKLFENLSHASNKAMNLNSYLGLMGKAFQIMPTGDGAYFLAESSPETADLKIESADYVLTLDADSLVLPDYALRLIDIMEKDERIAVAQTPYSALPGASTLIERIAGATTDIQYKIHQGFTHYRATFWVGANAVLRYEALQDIRQIVKERGHDVPVFIQDKTVIEDTGSTIDLIQRGWSLFNYPMRLAYSATPPDFGALLIQRRRWANGGLIILPELFRFAFRQYNRPKLIESWMRAHYLCSPTLGSFGLLLVLLLPFDPGLSTPWIPLAALPYYALYGRDLRRAGYRLRDLGPIYALTLLLVPINIAGVMRSIEQIVTGRKSAFGRTPKIERRTTAAPVHIASQWLLFAFLLYSIGSDFAATRYSFAAFTLVNAGFLFYGISSLIGWREGWEDLKCGFTTSKQSSPGSRPDGQLMLPNSPVELFDLVENSECCEVIQEAV